MVKPTLRRYLLAHKRDNILKHTDISLTGMNWMEYVIRLHKDTIDKLEWKFKIMKQLDGV